MQPESLFEKIIEYPNTEAEDTYKSLVGIEHIKSNLSKEATLVLDPTAAAQWSNHHYDKEIALLKALKGRPPLFIFSGDVGTGKSALAESFADQIARQHDVAVYLYKLSLNARGSGMVGEMTKLLSEAFKVISDEATKRANGGKSSLVLLIDEADAIAQSREGDQMHHEDKAGVIALIRGIDSIVNSPIPVMVVMCTNRPGALDPAIKRRCAHKFDFVRPSLEDCKAILSNNLADLGLSDEDIQTIASMCVSHVNVDYGYTYSDITHRLLPNILLNAIPNEKITNNLIHETIKNLPPTDPFTDT